MTTIHDFVSEPHWALHFQNSHPVAIKLRGIKFISGTYKVHDDGLRALTQSSRGSFRMWNGIKVIAFYPKLHKWTVIMFEEQHRHHATLCKLEFG